MKLITMLMVMAGFSAVMAAPVSGMPPGQMGAAPAAAGRYDAGERGGAGRISDRPVARIARGEGKVSGRSAKRNRGSLNGSDEKLVDAIDSADTLAKLRRYAPQVMQAGVEVREAYVDALSDKGSDAVLDIAPFIADSNKEVADAAFDAWKDALDEVSASRRIQMIVQSAALLQRQGAMPQGGAGRRIEPRM